MYLFHHRYQKRVYNIIDDVIEWDPRLALSGMMDGKPSEEVNVTVTETETDNNFTDGGDDKDMYNHEIPNQEM